MADANPAAGAGGGKGGGGSNTFPALLFLAILFFSFVGSGEKKDADFGVSRFDTIDSGNSRSLSSRSSRGESGEENAGVENMLSRKKSSFVLEVTPVNANVGVGGGAEFLVRYHNGSSRVLHGAMLEIAVPKNAKFDFHSGTRGWYVPESPGQESDAVYDLGEIAPGELGEVRFAENIAGGRDGVRQETAVRARWETGGEGFRKKEPIVLGQAMVKTEITVRKALAKSAPTKLGNETPVKIVENSRAASTSSPQKSGVENTLAALSGATGKSLISPVIGWVLFALLFFGAAFFVWGMGAAPKNILAREEIAAKNVTERKKDLLKDISRDMRDMPPENLPI